jgi:hypothetical protein
LRCAGHFCIDGAIMFAFAVGVGSHKPESVALVRGANVVRSQHTPPRIIPQRGKVAEDSGKASSHKHR